MILNTATVLLALVSLCQSRAIVGWGVGVGVAVENLPLWLRKRKDSRGENHPFQGFHEVPEAVRIDRAAHKESDNWDVRLVSHRWLWTWAYSSIPGPRSHPLPIVL